MSRHISRKSRWQRQGPNAYRSEPGHVFYRNGQWHAALCYRILNAETMAPGEVESWIASKFKRPRNAMIALEDKVLELRRRDGARVRFAPTA